MALWMLLAGEALAAGPWAVTPLHVGVDIAGVAGDVASAVAVTGAPGTLYFTVEREAKVGPLRLRQLHLGSVTCAPDWTGCGLPALVPLGPPSAAFPSAASIAVEPAADLISPPRIHVLRAARVDGRCLVGGAADLEEWIYDPATGATEVWTADVPTGCDDDGQSRLAVDGDTLWACWTRDPDGAGSDAETWCGARDLALAGDWAAWSVADGVAATDDPAFALLDGAPLVLYRDRDATPDAVALTWGAGPASPLPQTPRQASAPSVATAPDGTLHAVWLDGPTRIQYAKCDPAAADCADAGAWLPQPRPVRIGSALADPELAISDDGRMFVAWTEDTDPSVGDARRVFTKEKCLAEPMFTPGAVPGELVAEAAAFGHDQSLRVGSPHLWADASALTVHLGFTEHDSTALLPLHGDALWARRAYDSCAPAPVDERIASFEAIAAAAGYTVQRGAYSFLEPADCCMPGGTCYGNNPGGSYGYAFVPPAPGQTSLDTGEVIGDAHQFFHLAPDEAVVILGNTPPPARYFGFRTHVAYREFAGVLEFVLATNGLDLHSWTFEQHRGDADVSLEPMAVVTSADAGVELGVHALLEEAGFLASEIEDDRIGADITRLGLGDLDDQLAMVHRAAVFDDPAAEAAYRADPGLVVLRLTPSAPLAAPEPHAYPGLPPTGSGTDESAWAPSLDALEAAILASAPGFSAAGQTFVPAGVSPDRCLATGATCGDLSSRLFARTGLFQLPPDGSFAVAFGVNHERTGKALYSSFAAQAWAHNVGLEAIDSVEMVGTASGFLPGDPLVDDLFAVYLARDCAAFPGAACMEIPEGCPGVEPFGQLYGASRLYVDPITGVAPDGAEVLTDRLLVFTPVGP